MTVITTRLTVAPDGTLSGRLSPGQVPPGEHEAAITVASPARQEPTEPFDVDSLPTHDLGPWPEGLSLRREDLYGDDGR